MSDGPPVPMETKTRKRQSDTERGKDREHNTLKWGYLFLNVRLNELMWLQFNKCMELVSLVTEVDNEMYWRNASDVLFWTL